MKPSQNYKEVKMAEEKTKTKEKKERFELVEVPTETILMARDNVSDVVLNDKAVLVEILNKLEEINKQLG